MTAASVEAKNPTLPQKKVSSARVLAAAALGQAVEWYDFFIYGTAAALVFSQVFFPNSDPATDALTAFAGFGAGFIMRPLVAMIIGHLGDKYGRRPMLVATVLLVGSATVAIGLLSSYAAIGIWAPSLLVLLRLLQGFAVGGAWGGTALMAVERAPPRCRTFYGSFPQSAVPVAYLISGQYSLCSKARSIGRRFSHGAGESRSCSASWSWPLPSLCVWV
jgi:MFS family permease